MLRQVPEIAQHHSKLEGVEEGEGGERERGWETAGKAGKAASAK